MTHRKYAGFTLIELLVAMSIIALLLTLATPRYFGNIDRAKEAVLKENLATIRDVIDKHFADRGTYPEKLEDLVADKYLRKVPTDPYTDSNVTWVIMAPPTPGATGIYDVHTASIARASNGTLVSEW